jgi:CshA-type fibril repeat protein
LTASQAGDSTYSAAANVTRTFVITTAEAYVPFKPELKPGKGSGKIDQPVTVKPEVKAEGNNPSLCLVDLADLGCKQTVTVPGVGTFSIVNGSVTFSPVKGFVGEAKIVLRATDVYQQKIDQTITFLIAIEPDTKPVVAAETSAAATGATTNRKSLAVELPANEIPGATICIALVDASDCHPTSANDANIGTWLIAASGKVNFTPNPAFVGVANAEIRIIAANYKRIIPLAVTVTKRPPVTVTIGNFIDGSPVITKAIASKIRAFMKKYPDYANIECIGYTEGPTVLKTDRALSAARAKNACAYVTKSLTKKFVKVTRKAAQETVEASERRRITITLTD